MSISNKHISVRKTLVTLVLLMAGLSGMNAQDEIVVRDLNLWTGVEIEKTVFDRWTLSLQQEVRLEKNATAFNSTFTQLGIEYELSKNFSLAGKYRYILNKKADEEIYQQSRYNADLSYKGRLKHISVSYRIRYQKEADNLQFFGWNETSDRYLRNRISISYTDLKKIKPYLHGEFFQIHETGAFLNKEKFRVTAGVKMSPKNVGTFNVSYGIEHELTEILPYTYFILKMNYKYEF